MSRNTFGSISGIPVIIDYLDYGLMGADQSYGSYPEGDPYSHQAFDTPTPGNPNNPTSQPEMVWIKPGTTQLHIAQDKYRCTTEAYSILPAARAFVDPMLFTGCMKAAGYRRARQS